MSSLKIMCDTFRRDTRGVTSIEYALLGALIAMVIIGAVSLLGTNLKALYDMVAAEVP
ncbi:pilus assembly protein Flp/PilA [Cupriavidus metallidurans]|jgi:pilus assembly protein Flp/PilA|uniref:Flp/Fap pilin component Putative pilus subunit protein n=1 Tax=Cupriavidus metallidurans (strain ATCC 43123 / DSM 2839 / NBRC 102507 / CH34) TaxID=266264 RepID=Q1LQN9_CUPMC|nr:Flp family type IVb pilin [Cupriavidus metallidurans]ABF07537.1 Flp/Fap pilin component; Putative pilus subunit protein [Cupriavidus metallidurans CH34]AVA32776.1 Flp family type IVb pilin [Cupriavidus metallidurans]MDE4916945.1 Flp family type IVb pilin [Cupriavidus metallidurans]QGS28145.1 Flp family type IVb pilin [Cupriavidus metallidurans]UBM11635.1 Flp family type IVb pilin [Cupriavidus metallidurans]